MAASRNFRDFERRLDRIARRMTAGVELLVQNVAEEIGDAVVIYTPVDTGYARGNWRPSLNAPAGAPISVLDPTGQATVARIVAVARQYRVGQTLYIVNNAPYIGSLNEGSSPQAPPGFVQDAIRDGFEAGVRAFAGGVIEATR